MDESALLQVLTVILACLNVYVTQMSREDFTLNRLSLSVALTAQVLKILETFT